MVLRALIIHTATVLSCICPTFLLLDPKNIPRRSGNCQNYYVESIVFPDKLYKTIKKLFGG